MQTSEKTRARRSAVLAPIVLAALLFLASCGGESGSGGAVSPEETQTPGGAPTTEETTAEEQPLTLAEATVGPNENSSMLPAGGREADPAQPPPENPPEGVKTYPATTNETVDEPIEYDRDPPTNGDHDLLWQNCGFYSQPIENRHAVHSMDHGVVWISFNPNLPQEQIEALRPYGKEPYVIVSPYPGLRAPVVVTAWRNQLELDRVDDPRLRQFVDQYRVSETSPLSGNGCTGGVGEPEA